MKKILLSIVFFTGTYAQAQSRKVAELNNDWYHQNYATSEVYGVADDAARSYLSSKGIVPQPLIVAIIDSGVDPEHEDLMNTLWVNQGEIAANGLDDDNNGYIDDVNGWNFIGNPNGDNVAGDTLEITRLYVKYKALFESEDRKANKKNIKKQAEDYSAYLELKPKYLKKYKEAKRGYAQYAQNYEQMKAAISASEKHFFGKHLSPEVIASFQPISRDEESFASFMKNLQKNVSVEELSEISFSELKKELLGTSDYYYSQYMYHYSPTFNSRKIVGDDYENKKEIGYGSNQVEGPDALHGTHVAGIVAAERNNGKGMDGIGGNHIQIMSIRAVPNGDERDKDVANAIRYAVDNGAKIINMSFGKGYSPYQYLVTDAIKYATKKDVLMVHASGNSDMDIDREPNFPTNYSKGKEISNTWITVGASTRYNDKLKASFSNFGSQQIDVFAPGLEIYSSIPDDKYKLLQGTSMASPVVVGVAALLWSHFPKLTAVQVKEILMATVNKGNSEFQKLSVSGGVVDALRAVQLAETK